MIQETTNAKIMILMKLPACSKLPYEDFIGLSKSIK